MYGVTIKINTVHKQYEGGPHRLSRGLRKKETTCYSLKSNHDHSAVQPEARSPHELFRHT